MHRCPRLLTCLVVIAGLLSLFACATPPYSDTGKGTYRDLSGVSNIDITSRSAAGPGIVGAGMYKSGPPTVIGGQIPGPGSTP